MSQTECFDHGKVRAQPAAVEPAPFPGDADDQRASAEHGQEEVKDDVDDCRARFAGAGHQVIDAEMPRIGQEIGVALGEVVAEQVENGRDGEEREKAHLRKKTRALQLFNFHCFSRLTVEGPAR